MLLLGVAATSVALATAAAQFGECAAGKAEAGDHLVQVWVKRGENGELEYPRVVTLARDPARTFGVAVYYDGSRPALSTPRSIEAWAYMPLSDRTRIRETVQWRHPGGDWMGPDRFVFPFPNGSEGQAYTMNSIAWGGTRPRAPELLESAANAPRLDLRRVTQGGVELTSATVQLAPLDVLLPLYEQAKAEAVAKLPECAYRVVIPAAPR